DRKAFGVVSALYPVIEQLKILFKDGISIFVNGKHERVYFRLAYVHGDNLSLNEVLGFSQSFNAKYYCRFCKAEKCEMQGMCIENSALLRNNDNYLGDAAKFDFSSTGIASKSCLHDENIPFDITKNYVVDLLHDLLVGVCKYVIAYVLLELITVVKVLSIDHLNARIRYFNYGPNDSKNKPTEFTLNKLKDLKVLKCIRFAPLIFGDLVPSGLKCWKLFLLMREITLIVTAPYIKKNSLDYLAFIIKCHNKLFIELYDTLKPKMHFLFHYPRLILRFFFSHYLLGVSSRRYT
ncbi:hypothetical protein B566_EDAN016580, partial [Ephemera danica]